MGRFHHVLLVSVVFTVAGRLASAACPPFDPPATIAVGHRPDALAAGDVNGDGFPDLVVANSYDVSVLFGDGAAGDLDSDGPIDLVAADWESDEVSVLLGDGNGAFGVETRYPSGAVLCGSRRSTSTGVGWRTS